MAASWTIALLSIHWMPCAKCCAMVNRYQMRHDSVSLMHVCLAARVLSQTTRLAVPRWAQQGLDQGQKPHRARGEARGRRGLGPLTAEERPRHSGMHSE